MQGFRAPRCCAKLRQREGCGALTEVMTQERTSRPSRCRCCPCATAVPMRPSQAAAAPPKCPTGPAPHAPLRVLLRLKDNDGLLRQAVIPKRAQRVDALRVALAHAKQDDVDLRACALRACVRRMCMHTCVLLHGAGGAVLAGSRSGL